MSQVEKTVGAVGLVRIGALEVTVTPLSQAEEIALDRELRDAAEADAGDHYTRCRPLLEAMKDNPADRLEAVREIARMAARKEPLSGAALYAYQTGAAGIALELYHRGRKATPGLTIEALRAVVTKVNATEVFAALQKLIEGGDPK